MDCCIKNAIDCTNIEIKQEHQISNCLRSIPTLKLCNHTTTKRIPRPPNAFMLYANENRKTMAQLHPADSNKEISKRLGEGWKSLGDLNRTQYFERAKVIDLEHKKKYPNYSYNPKEARIRKAMREAMRDRSIGASPMLPRPSARRAAHPWMGTIAHEELLMTSPNGSLPPPGIRPSPLDFPNGNGQFIPSMNSGYGKMNGSLPHTNNSVHSEYMQSNPLAQLQQQTELWNNYPSTSSNHYMINNQMSAEYTESSTEVSSSSPIVLEDGRHQRIPGLPTSPVTGLSTSPPHTNENQPPIDDQQGGKSINQDLAQMYEKPLTDSVIVHPLMESGNVQQPNEQFVQQMYDPQNLTHMPLNKSPEEHISSSSNGKRKVLNESYPNKRNSNTLYLPLSCTKFSASPELFTNNIEYHREYIAKYFQNIPDYDVLNVTTEDGISFPYVTTMNFKVRRSGYSKNS